MTWSRCFASTMFGYVNNESSTSTERRAGWASRRTSVHRRRSAPGLPVSGVRTYNAVCPRRMAACVNVEAWPPSVARRGGGCQGFHFAIDEEAQPLVEAQALENAVLHLLPDNESIIADDVVIGVQLRAGLHPFAANQPVSSGGGDTAPDPTQLGLGGLCAYTAITLRMYATRKGLAIGTIQVPATYPVG